MALSRRIMTSWRSRAGSPTAASASGPPRAAPPRRPPAVRAPPRRPRRRRRGGAGRARASPRRSRSGRAAAGRRRARVRCCTSASMSASASPTSATGCSPLRRRSSTELRMTVSGVRSSWLASAANSRWRRSAARCAARESRIGTRARRAYTAPKPTATSTTTSPPPTSTRTRLCERPLLRGPILDDLDEERALVRVQRQGELPHGDRLGTVGRRPHGDRGVSGRPGRSAGGAGRGDASGRPPGTASSRGPIAWPFGVTKIPKRPAAEVEVDDATAADLPARGRPTWSSRARCSSWPRRRLPGATRRR